MDGAFSVAVPVGRVWKDDEGEMWFEGIASSTTVDKQNERMTQRAIEKMASAKGIDLLPSHQAGALEELGTVTEAAADNDKLKVVGKLDADNPAAVRFFSKVASGRPYQLSVGGRVKSAYWEFDKNAKKHIKHIDDVELEHVAVCRPGRAANPDTYLAVMAKSAEAVLEGEPMADEVSLTEDAKKGLLAGIGDVLKSVLGKADEDKPIEEPHEPEKPEDKPTEEPVAPEAPQYATSTEVAELRDAVNALSEGLQAFLGGADEEKPTEEKPEEKPVEETVAAEDSAPQDLATTIKRTMAERIMALEKTDEEKVSLMRLVSGQVDDLQKSIEALEGALAEHDRTQHKGRSQAAETPGTPVEKSEKETKNDRWRDVLK